MKLIDAEFLIKQLRKKAEDRENPKWSMEKMIFYHNVADFLEQIPAIKMQDK